MFYTTYCYSTPANAFHFRASAGP